MIRLRRLAQLSIIALCSAVMSCASDATPGEIQSLVDSIQVTLGLKTLVVGQTVQAGAIAMTAAGGQLGGQTIAWATSNAAVATVSSTGLVTAVSVGTATITASASGKTASATVTVVATAAPVATVSVALSATTAAVGQTVTATATMRDASGATLSGRAVSWASTNTGVATVDTAGVVTAVGAGTASINATSEGVVGGASLSVQAALVPVASVSVTIATPGLVPGQSTNATATLRDAGDNVLTGRATVWSSSNSAVATVTQAGVVLGVGSGTATISATSETIAGSAGVTVTAQVATVNVSFANNPIGVSGTTQASAVCRDPINNPVLGRPLSWSSVNPSIATVSSAGVVRGVAIGTSAITATCDGIPGSATVNVAAAVAAVKVTLAASQIRVGLNTTALATVTDSFTNVLTGRVIVWSSADPSIALVGVNGDVVGVAPGTTNVKATVDGVVGQAAIVVVAGTTGSGPVPKSIAITQQPGGAVSGVVLTTAPVVEVRDSNNVIVPTANNFITAAIASGTGTIVNGATTNAVNGVATFSGLKIVGVGPHTLTFTATGLPTVTSSSFPVTQTPASLQIAIQPTGAATGSPLTTQPVIRILDAGDLLIANSSLAVTASISSGSGTLQGTTTVNSVGGIATFSNLQVNGQGNTVLAFSTSNPLLQVLSASFPVAQGQPTHLAMSTQPAGALSGVPFTTQPAVAVQDATNAAVLGNTSAVTAVIASGSGTLLGTTTVSAVNGLATFTNLKINGSGAHTLRFTSGALTQTTSAAVTVTQAAGALAVLTQPAGAVSGVQFVTQPSIQIVDNAGLPITSSTLAVTATVTSGTGTLSGTTTVNAIAGVATFTSLKITGTGNHVLTFSTSSPSLAVASVQFNVGASAQTATQLVITTAPAGAVSGINLATQPVAEIRDASNARVSGSSASVTVGIASGTGTLSGTTTVTASSGIATFTNLKINGSGANSIVFTSNGLTSATSGSIAVSQTAASLSMQTQPNGAVTGSPLTTQPVVRILDNAGLLIANSTLAVTATRTTGNGVLSGTTTVNAAGGVATFTNLRVDGSGTNVLTFSTTVPALSVASTGFTVAAGGQTAGPPAKLAVVLQPAGAASGFAFATQPVVQVQDAAGILVTTSTASVSVALLSGTGTLAGTQQVNAVAGIATFTNLAITGTGNFSLNFTSGTLTAAASGSFVVTQSTGVGVLSGLVSDLSAHPVGGGTVEILNSSGTVLQTATVQANGVYTVNSLPVGTYGVRLEPPLAYSMGPAEPIQQTVTITANQSSVSQPFAVQPALFSEDFQSYSSTAQITGGCSVNQIPAGNFWSGPNRDLQCTNPGHISLDPIGGPHGTSKAVRYDFQANPFAGGGANLTNYCNANTTITLSPRMNPPPIIPADLWVRFTSMESANFAQGSASCVGNTGTAYKFFLINIGPFNSGGGQGRFGTYLGQLSSNSLLPPGMQVDMEDRLNTGAHYTPGPGNVPIGNPFYGSYHTFVLHMSNMGTNNARFQVYLNGVIIHDITGPLWPGGQVIGGLGQIIEFAMGSNINNGPDVAQQRWFRELAVYTTRPSLLPLP